MFTYKTLENTSIYELHRAFINAFSDYEVKMNLPLLRFKNMLKKNGYIAKYSIGAFKDDILVGFTLTAIRKNEGKLIAYDTATAVIKQYRNIGITSNIFNILKDRLKRIGVETYQLEVIQNNEAAVKTYKNQGFRIFRELNCFKLDKKTLTTNVMIENKNILTNDEWQQVKCFWDFRPSWQNSIESIKNSEEQYVYSIIYCDEKIAAYGVMDRNTGDIEQIAVNKKYRGNGYGKAIVLDLVNWAESNIITILNVDANNSQMEGFLNHIGFSYYVKQYEMVLKI